MAQPLKVCKNGCAPPVLGCRYIHQIRLMFKKLFEIFTKKSEPSSPQEACDAVKNANNEEMKKFLIVGLGNIGPEYVGTRHNIGFMMADRLVEDCKGEFNSCRYGAMATVRVKNCELKVLKPSTFMNLSGTAVRYWMNKEKLPLSNLLVLVDDIALPFGTIRLRGNGSDAGHNGLKDIASELGTQSYGRLRFGVGNEFPRGGQVDYVLGTFPAEEMKLMPERLEKTSEAIKTFCLSGLGIAMTQFNGK